MNPKTYTRTSGPWQQTTRTGHRLLCADGRIRAAELTSQSPDTFFSHPARLHLYPAAQEIRRERA